MGTGCKEGLSNDEMKRVPQVLGHARIGPRGSGQRPESPIGIEVFELVWRAPLSVETGVELEPQAALVDEIGHPGPPCHNERREDRRQRDEMKSPTRPLAAVRSEWFGLNGDVALMPAPYHAVLGAIR